MFEKSTSDARPNPDEPKPANPNHLRRDIHRLTLDWIELQQLPQPARNNIRQPAYREYGHRAEWASRTAAKIADILTAWHDYTAEHRGETRPRRKLLARTPEGCDIWQYAASEHHRVPAAWNYLEPRIEQLATLAPAEAFTEISDLHHHIRHTLGHTQPRQILPMPCPNTECGLLTLTRRIAVGKDLIVCSSCGYTVREDNYRFLVRIAIDTLTDTQPA